MHSISEKWRNVVTMTQVESEAGFGGLARFLGKIGMLHGTSGFLYGYSSIAELRSTLR